MTCHFKIAKLISVRLLSKFCFNNYFATKKSSKKTKNDVIRLFTNMGERENLSESSREINLPTIGLRSMQNACHTNLFTAYTVSHHKALKGSLLVVKQMQMILAFGFDSRRLKVFFLFKYASSIRVNANRTYYKSAGEYKVFYPCSKYLSLVRFAHL